MIEGELERESGTRKNGTEISREGHWCQRVANVRCVRRWSVCYLPALQDCCRACSAAKEKGSPYCKNHKQCFQCIMRNALRKNKDQTYVDPGQAAAFEAIFGKGRDGPPNLPLEQGGFDFREAESLHLWQQGCCWCFARKVGLDNLCTRAWAPAGKPSDWGHLPLGRRALLYAIEEFEGLVTSTCRGTLGFLAGCPRDQT